MHALRHIWVLLVAVSVLTAGLLVPALGTAEGSWSTPVDLSETGGSAWNQRIGVSADGRTIATIWRRWADRRNTVQAKISTDHGSTWRKHDLSAPGRNARNPDVGVSADGRTIATTWKRYDGRDWIVQAKISTDSGTTWTSHNLSAPGGSAKYPLVAVSADGKTIATTWRHDNGSDFTTKIAISTDSGTTWTEQNLSAPGQDETSPQVGVSADGRTIATTWRRYNGTHRVIRAKISVDSGATWTTHDLSAPDRHAREPQMGQVAVSADGKTIATTWSIRSVGSDDEAGGRVHAKISGDRGRTWTAHDLSDPSQKAHEPQVGVSGDGKTIATTWYLNDNRTVQAKTSSDRGNTWTKHNLSDPGLAPPSPRVGVSTDGKTIAAVWTQENDSDQVIVQVKTSTDSDKAWTAHDLSGPSQAIWGAQVAVSAHGESIVTVWNRVDGSDSIVQASIYPAPAPAAPSAASYTPLKGDRTRVRWTRSAGATGYRVVINGKTKCTRSASKSRCTAEKAYGPRAKVRVIALGADANSPATKAKYQKSAKTIVFGTVHFRPKSAKLTKKNKTIVRKKTKALARQGFKRTTVFGYTAKECTPKKLSKKRAQAVKKVMRKKLRTMDVSMRIKTVAKGNKNPIGNNNTKKGRAKNRRATINIR